VRLILTSKIQEKAAQRKAAEQKVKAKGKQQRALRKEGINESADPDAARQTRGRTRKTEDPKALEGKRIWIRWDAEGPITQGAKRSRGSKGETKATALVVSYFPALKRYRVKWDDNGEIMDVNLNDISTFAMMKTQSLFHRVGGAADMEFCVPMGAVSLFCALDACVYSMCTLHYQDSSQHPWVGL